MALVMSRYLILNGALTVQSKKRNIEDRLVFYIWVDVSIDIFDLAVANNILSWQVKSQTIIGMVKTSQRTAFRKSRGSNKELIITSRDAVAFPTNKKIG
jgi:DNA-directed RNA polymerase alpha subunit